MAATTHGQYPPLATAVRAGAPKPTRPLKVCIVTPEVDGPSYRAVRPKAATQLAHFLAAVGHEVTIYLTSASDRPQTSADGWADHYSRHGISFVRAEEADPPSTSAVSSRAGERPRRVHEWLKDQAFDVVHMVDSGGDGYFALLSKKLGLSYGDTRFVVRSTAPTALRHAAAARPISDVQALLVMELERKCVELADVFVAHSRYLLDWMTASGYRLPALTYHQPELVIPQLERPLERFPEPTRREDRVSVDEIVFFSPLEWRMGLRHFCNAVAGLGKRPELPDLTVTFLGRGTPDKHAFVEQQSEQWEWTWRIIDDLEPDQATAYLEAGGRLACVPAVAAHPRSEVRELLMRGLPFIASAVADVAELVHPDDAPAILFPRASPQALTERLSEAVVSGAVVGRPSVDPAESRSVWEQFHDTLAAEFAVRPRNGRRATSTSDSPRVSVCIAHHDRPSELAAALDSLRAMSYPDFEVILVDDGSEDSEALEYLESLDEEFLERGWRIVYQDNQYVGAARNRAATQATGTYLLFMADDDLAKPNELEVFADAARHAEADVLSCFADAFVGEAPELADKVARDTPVGDCFASGVTANVIGGTNLFVGRKAFEELGGFAEDRVPGLYAYDFLLKAVARGYRVSVVPEPLFWHRTTAHRIDTEFHPGPEARVRALRSATDGLDASLQMVIRLAAGAATELPRLRSRHGRLAEEAGRLQRDYELLRRCLTPED